MQWCSSSFWCMWWCLQLRLSDHQPKMIFWISRLFFESQQKTHKIHIRKIPSKSNSNLHVFLSLDALATQISSSALEQWRKMTEVLGIKKSRFMLMPENFYVYKLWNRKTCDCLEVEMMHLHLWCNRIWNWLCIRIYVDVDACVVTRCRSVGDVWTHKSYLTNRSTMVVCLFSYISGTNYSSFHVWFILCSNIVHCKNQPTPVHPAFLSITLPTVPSFIALSYIFNMYMLVES